MFSTPLSNVPLGTADILSYAMLVVVAVFLLSAFGISYYYWKKNKRMKAAPPTGPA
jgi:preprotein translocase subunit SecG